MPLTAQNQRGKIGAAGAAVLGIQTNRNDRPRNDLKAILTGTSHSYNLDKSLQSRDYKDPQLSTNQKFPSLVTADDTKMTKQPQNANTKKVDARHLDSIFLSTSKTHTFSQN